MMPISLVLLWGKPGTNPDNEKVGGSEGNGVKSAFDLSLPPPAANQGQTTA